MSFKAAMCEVIHAGTNNPRFSYYINRAKLCTTEKEKDMRVYIVECAYWTEPKATCRQCKNQPNAYNMYTDLEGILSACLYLHVRIPLGVVNFCRYFHTLRLSKGGHPEL
jgi:hypothetical protein